LLPIKLNTKNFLIISETLKLKLQRKRTNDEYSTTSHNIVKNTNPVSVVLEGLHRYGNQRGIGNVVQALISLRKMTVLQEVSNLLPAKERAEVLEEINKTNREMRREPRRRQGRSPNVYRCKSEFATPHPEEEGEAVAEVRGTLMGTIRAVRKTHSPSAISPVVYQPPEAVSPLCLARSASNTSEMVHIMASMRVKQARRSELTTQL